MAFYSCTGPKIIHTINHGIVAYSFIPVIATPLIKYFCVKRKMMITGEETSKAAVMSRFSRVSIWP
jgi:hypothetical protein